jgi:uncharacterized phage-associated protein
LVSYKKEEEAMFPLDRGKTLQAMALLLGQSSTGRIKYLKLLKLLYIADRETLRDKGHPITGGQMSAMPHGPVNSFACDFVRGQGPVPAWNRYIALSGYYAVLVESPGVGSLSKYEIGKLKEVFTRYKHMTEFQLRDLTHGFAEWIKNNPGNSSRPISLKDILEGVGRGDAVEGVQEEADAACALLQTIGL